MVADAVSSARDTPHDVRWKWLLLGLCAVGVILVAFNGASWFGIGGRPWTGWWDSTLAPSGEPFVMRFGVPEAGGATARGGIREGDRADVREQGWAERVVLVTQPLATQPTKLVLRRGSSTFVTHVLGSTTFEGAALWKIWDIVPQLFLDLWFLACAALMAARVSSLFEGRLLAIILIWFAIPSFVTPNPTLTVLIYAFSGIFASIGLFLLVRLASQFGDRPPWRRLLEVIAYSVIALSVLWGVAFYVGIATLKFDPLPFYFNLGFNPITVVTMVTIAIVTVTAVASTPPQQRPRVGWLLLPIPFTGLASTCIGYFTNYVATWYALMFVIMSTTAISLIGAALVTYAILNRRVLDVGFVLSRAVVVSIVGLIVVVAFVLLEWVLGSVLTGVSHATGLIANASLALVIGVSLNYIHRHVDQSVDLVLFRKRHDDERALLAFSKEAAYITEWDALLDATLEKVRRHTDARSASVLIGANGFYSAVRSFGDITVASANENDEAILALKVWHKPIDPHHYETILDAALAAPMLARGKLYGVLLLGERAGGEAYAPDEVEALSQLANGVGAALESLSLATDVSAIAKSDQIEALHRAVVSLGDRLSSEIRALCTSSPA